jgi:hypothetical protein
MLRNLKAALLAAGVLTVLASPALAAEQATARDIQAAVDSYVASAGQDTSLVGGPGGAGYDRGFWIRGGDFSLRINATLQARWEAQTWDPVEPGRATREPNLGVGESILGTGGDLSGFSLPRALLKFSGTAPCNTRFYTELDFGHHGGLVTDFFAPTAAFAGNLGPVNHNPGGLGASLLREGWIEWGCNPALNFRMGLIKIPTTRQLLTPAELQQFVDISYASAFVGQTLPGYTDRPRDYGIELNGVFGCANEFSYMLAVTNGDGGDFVRNIHDGRTSDGVAISGRVNWAFLGATGYEESALRQNSCTWYGEFGAWAFYYSDRVDFPHTNLGDHLRAGADIQLGYGGLSFTGAFTYLTHDGQDNAAIGRPDVDGFAALAQLGYLFPDTAWEIAGRWSTVSLSNTAVGAFPARDGGVTEFAGVINYYLNGHGNKLSLDVAFLSADQDAWFFGFNNFIDPYAGYGGHIQPVTGNASWTAAQPANIQNNDIVLIRFQWQLAL